MDVYQYVKIPTLDQVRKEWGAENKKKKQVDCALEGLICENCSKDCEHREV